MSKDAIQGNLVVYSKYRHPEHPDYEGQQEQQPDEDDLYTTCATLAEQRGIDLQMLIKLIQIYFDLEHKDPPRCAEVVALTNLLLETYNIRTNWRLAVAELLGVPPESPVVVAITA